jgi:uncharacterized protein YfaP (DUF2135 family)
MFKNIKQQIQQRFKELVNNGPIFYVSVDKEKIWDVYLNAFPEQYKQENTCNCCKSFIRQFSGLVGIKDNKILTLWDFVCTDPEYANSVKAMRDYILSCEIDSVYVNSFAKLGTDQSPDPKRNLVWDHYFVNLPQNMVMPETKIGPHQGTARDDKNVLKRSLEEITDEAVNTTLELIAQNSLYRGNEHKATLVAFNQIKEKFKKTPPALRDNFCWVQSINAHAAVCRVRNTSIGTLLVDLSEGRDLDSAVSAFERVVAPANYKRPTALVTPAMIEKAQERLTELGMLGSLERRILDSRDLNVNNTLFVHRPSGTSVSDVFAELKKDTIVNPKSLNKVEEISIQDFVDKVLPTAKAIKVLVENHHMPNFVTMVGPKNADDPTMFKWGNNYSWAYTGDVADSIKERVKSAGGNVTGVLRVSLSWSNYDDLDLHVIEPNNYRIYYGTREQTSPSGGMLDVDMNAGFGQSRQPVENICWAKEPRLEGKYAVVVNNYARRDNKDGGFEVEIEYNSETEIFTSSTNAATGKNFNIVEFNYTKKDGVQFINSSGKSNIAKYNSREKWGVKTGQFVPVRAITLSPNFWDVATGNKHYMFLLEDCKSDEKTRPFFNEFLKPELSVDRKVFEILGSKVTVENAEDELSGIGFSDTVRNHVFVEVEGTFKRVVKVNF